MRFISIAVLSLLSSVCNITQAFPTPRTQAPSFSSVNAVVKESGKDSHSFQKLSLSDYNGKYVVLVFYPFDFTYVCPTELLSFSENIQKFRDLGAEVLAISTDSHFTHLAWINTPRQEGGLGKSIQYPMIADISKNISKDYGVLITDENDPMNGAAIRGMFILDKKHVIRSVQINDDAVGRNVDEALRLIQGFQFADENGEVCPANWKPGDKTIKPDQIKKNEFFSVAYNGESQQVNSHKYPEQEPADNSKFTVTRLNEGDKDGKNPQKGQRVSVHYTGKLLDGKVFDSSVTRGQPFQFVVGTGQVIKCWDEGIPQLVKGQKAILNCPADYAYGQRGAGGLIPPGATLKFEVELLNF